MDFQHNTFGYSKLFQHILIKRLKPINFLFKLFILIKPLINKLINYFVKPFMDATFLNCANCRHRWADVTAVLVAMGIHYPHVFKAMQENNIDHIHPNWVNALKELQKVYEHCLGCYNGNMNWTRIKIEL